MSKLLEFFLGSILITILTVASMFFSMLHYVIKVGGVGDCAWHSSAKAWIDSNGDGLINNGEAPLSNVEIHIDDIENQLFDVSWPSITDRYGNVQLSVSIPGCSDTVFEIYVDIPEGYRITTRPRIEVNPNLSGNVHTEPVYYFGFKSDR
jgi:hypothetical protein